MQNATAGVLALDGDDGYPYALPLSYVYHDAKLYFHCAKAGHKLDALKRNEKVSFCVIERDDIKPEEFTSYFRSVIVFGKAHVVEGDLEKRAAMEALATKYAPDHQEKGMKEIDREWNLLCMIEFDAMAAAAVSVPFVEILIAIAMAVASGAGIMVSRSLAQGEKKHAQKTFTLSILLLLAIGVFISVAGNILIDPFATLLGATPDIHADAVSYLWYIVTFASFQLLSFLLGGLARNDGRPKLAMSTLAIGSISNIILDYVFMYPLNMGIAGAALATALGPIFSVMILLPHFLQKKGSLCFTKIAVKLQHIKEIFVLGFPSFIIFFIEIVVMCKNTCKAIIVHGKAMHCKIPQHLINI